MKTDRKVIKIPRDEDSVSVPIGKIRPPPSSAVLITMLIILLLGVFSFCFSIVRLGLE